MGKSQSSVVNSEKLLDEMFVLMEYSDNVYDFVTNLSKEAFEELRSAIGVREAKSK